MRGFQAPHPVPEISWFRIVGPRASERTGVCMQAYIDFEIANRERELTRALYERLLDRTKHVKVHARD